MRLKRCPHCGTPHRESNAVEPHFNMVHYECWSCLGKYDAPVGGEDVEMPPYYKRRQRIRFAVFLPIVLLLAYCCLEALMKGHDWAGVGFGLLGMFSALAFAHQAEQDMMRAVMEVMNDADPPDNGV